MDICYPTYEAPSDVRKYISVFLRLTFFTDDGCEHAKMKQFTLVTCNIWSQ